MTVYILVDWFLPAYKAGGPIQSIANLVAVLQTDGQYRVVCCNKDLDGKVLPVQTDTWVEYNGWTKVYYSSKGFPKDLKPSADDIVYINGMFSYPFNLRPLLEWRGKKVIAPRGMLHAGALSQKSFKKILYLSTWKALGLHQRATFHATTEEEKVHIQKVFGKKVKVHVASNFPRVFPKGVMREKGVGELHLVSIALISPMKNILRVVEGLEEVQAASFKPQEEGAVKIIYHIYGPVKEKRYWEECEVAIKKLPTNISVQYHGDVKPDKVEEALGLGHVFILPSKSENFGHSIYEALSAGKPVITSNTTPWNGLQEAKAGMNVDPDNVEALASAIRFFAELNAEELEKWSDGAKAYSEKAIDIEKIKEQYMEMFGVVQTKTTDNANRHAAV